MSNLLAYGNQVVGGAGGGGSTGGGHVIEDAAGVDLTQRDTMQFTGYINATDDSTNSKTVISAAPTTVEWSDWAEMTDAQKEGTHWLVVNAPNVGGQVDTNLLTKLWENPDPTASFGPQYITLSSSDYDFLLVIFRPTTSYNFQCAEIASKGAMLNLNYCSSSDSGSYSCQRSFGYASPTYIYAHPAQKSTGTDAAITDNAKCVPVAIYGFKKTITIDTSALIANVSTDASKCMLSGGETSVEDAIDELAAKPSTVVAGISMGSANNYITINYNFPSNIKTATITKVFSLGIAAQTVSIPCTIARHEIVSDVPAGTVLVYAMISDDTMASSIRTYATSVALELTYN